MNTSSMLGCPRELMQLITINKFGCSGAHFYSLRLSANILKISFYNVMSHKSGIMKTQQNAVRRVHCTNIDQITLTCWWHLKWDYRDKSPWLKVFDREVKLKPIYVFSGTSLIISFRCKPWEDYAFACVWAFLSSFILYGPRLVVFHNLWRKQTTVCLVLRQHWLLSPHSPQAAEAPCNKKLQLGILFPLETEYFCQ